MGKATKCNETSVPGSKIARHRPLFPRSRVYIFAGALRLRDIPTIESLEQATASCAGQTVRKAGGSDRRSIHEEWREDFRHSCWKTKKQIKELTKKSPRRILFSTKSRRSWTSEVNYSRLTIIRTLSNSNQNGFPLDFFHTFTVLLPWVTRILDNSKLPPTRSNFYFPSDHFHTILPSITQRDEYWLKHKVFKFSTAEERPLTPVDF